MKKTIYKNTFVVTVLSESPNYNTTNLSEIAYDIDEGDCVGKVQKIGRVELTGGEAYDEIVAVGSDPAFFFGEDEDEGDDEN